MLLTQNLPGDGLEQSEHAFRKQPLLTRQKHGTRNRREEQFTLRDVRSAAAAAMGEGRLSHGCADLRRLTVGYLLSRLPRLGWCGVEGGAKKVAASVGETPPSGKGGLGSRFLTVAARMGLFLFGIAAGGCAGGFGGGGCAVVADEAVPLVLPEEGDNGEGANDEGEENGFGIEGGGDLFFPRLVAEDQGAQSEDEEGGAFDAGEEDDSGFEEDEGEHAQDGHADQTAGPGHVEGLVAVGPDDHADDEADHAAAGGDGVFEEWPGDDAHDDGTGDGGDQGQIVAAFVGDLVFDGQCAEPPADGDEVKEDNPLISFEPEGHEEDADDAQGDREEDAGVGQVGEQLGLLRKGLGSERVEHGRPPWRPKAASASPGYGNRDSARRERREKAPMPTTVIGEVRGNSVEKFFWGSMPSLGGGAVFFAREVQPFQG